MSRSVKRQLGHLPHGAASSVPRFAHEFMRWYVWLVVFNFTFRLPTAYLQAWHKHWVAVQQMALGGLLSVLLLLPAAAAFVVVAIAARTPVFRVSTYAGAMRLGAAGLACGTAVTALRLMLRHSG
ncbi:MAG: hypothetical protein GIW99_02710 [Candidatus Eremiobacteraeota bacterium]|nr:hypothetical protein [Candidatus Eremiobacteraeota bacterium]MBC5826586.1 hypothetical protein [Candidatus Eremiobacteraeota bacterium]